MKEKVLQAMREFGAPVNAGKIAEIYWYRLKGSGQGFCRIEYNLERISEPSRRREQSKASIHTNCLADSNLKIG
jgi:hypothetical protein